MFGSKKRKEKEAAAEAGLAQEFAGKKEALQEEYDAALALKDDGQRLLALNGLKEKIAAESASRAEKIVAMEKGQMRKVKYSVMGTAGAGVVGIGAILLFPAAATVTCLVASCSGLVSAIAGTHIGDRADKKESQKAVGAYLRAAGGFSDFSFALSEKIDGHIQSILNHPAVIAQSTVQHDVFKKFPSVRDWFAEAGMKKVAAQAPAVKNDNKKLTF